MQTKKVISNLDSYLTLGGHYSTALGASETNKLNTLIVQNWSEKFKESLTGDLRQMLTNQNVDILKMKSSFNIMDSDAQGATPWKSYFTLSDKDETMDVVVCFPVSNGNAFIYLGASHTHFR